MNPELDRKVVRTRRQIVRIQLVIGGLMLLMLIAALTAGLFGFGVYGSHGLTR